ncbi:hypothetical protein AB0E04_45890 [Streptomyces sp. NPDC048251]|uniref:hypothetical protein n=1 Tax=Streptomyces sp. NPDC048251 TaxID=3154501 RepID=UPI00341DE488
MNFGQDHDGERHEPLSLSPDEKADGFAAVMQRLKGRTAHEQDRLRAQADAAVLGHEAYALGHDYRRRGNYVAAKRWLRVAADHSVPGAEDALEEIDAVTPAAPTTAADPAGIVPGASIPPPSPAHEDFGMWATVLESLDVAACAQAQARQITEQARRTAEDLLAEAQRTIRRERADSVRGLEKTRRTVARLLCQAEQVQLVAREIQEEARRQAEALLEEARGQAQQIVDEARAQADQTRAVTRQYNAGTHSEALATTALRRDAARTADRHLYANLEVARRVAEAYCEVPRESWVPLWRRRPLPHAQTHDLPTEVTDGVVRAIYVGETTEAWFQDALRAPSSGSPGSLTPPVIGHGRMLPAPDEGARWVSWVYVTSLNRFCDVQQVTAADDPSSAAELVERALTVRCMQAFDWARRESIAQDARKAEEAGHAAGR